MKTITNKIILFLSIFLTFGIFNTLSNKVFSEDAYIGQEVHDSNRVIERIPISDYIYPDEENNEFINTDNGTSYRMLIGGYKHHKENVANWESVSYYPLTHDFSPGPGGGNLTVQHSKTFGTTVSGSIHGLGISTSQSVTASAGYTAHVQPNRTARIVAAVYYQNERGLKVTTRYGRFISRDIYHVKKPTRVRLFLEYLNY